LRYDQLKDITLSHKSRNKGMHLWWNAVWDENLMYGVIRGKSIDLYLPIQINSFYS